MPNEQNRPATSGSRQHNAAETFKTLHTRRHGFVMPNAWDAGSAIILANEGFEAIATTSAGIAFSLGKPDYDVQDARLAVSRDSMFDRMRQIAEAVNIPVNGDLEAGYGDTPEIVAQTIRLAIDAGLAGGNIEDKIPGQRGLYPESLAVERIVAAREQISASRSAFVLTARTDVFAMQSSDAMETCIRRANRYREAGADCIFPPGVSDIELIQRLVREIDAPLNIVMGLGAASGNAGAILRTGVQRISLGGTFARSALGFIRASARELRDTGSIGFAAGQLSGSELNALFVGASL